MSSSIARPGPSLAVSSQQLKSGSRVKPLALLTAVGKEGRDILSLLGFDLTGTVTTFNQVQSYKYRAQKFCLSTYNANM